MFSPSAYAGMTTVSSGMVLGGRRLRRLAPQEDERGDDPRRPGDRRGDRGGEQAARRVLQAQSVVAAVERYRAERVVRRHELVAAAGLERYGSPAWRPGV